MMETLQKVGKEGTYLNIIKAICVKPTANIILNGETLKSFPLTSEIRQRYALLSHLLNVVLKGSHKLWKILKEMGIPDLLTCPLRNLYAVQEAAVRTGHGTTDWFQIGKGVHPGCISSPCLFNLYAEYIM